MRSFFLWVVLGMAVVAFAGCADGSAGQRATGELTAQLVIGSNVDITEINYTISGNGVAITDTVPVVTNPVQIKVSGLPIGTGYTITLASADGVCTGTATFDVVENQTTGVTVPIQCSDVPPARGEILVNGEFLLCPTITALSASPIKAALGAPIQVKAVATNLGQGTLTYSWTASNDGTYADPAAAKTTYACATTGTKTLTIAVSNVSCTDLVSVDVTCEGGTAPVCGNGTVEGTEQCEPPNTATCDANCKTIVPVPVCGDGTVEGTEQCEPPNTATCDANCQTIIPTCGNGKLDANEKCDTAISSGAGVCPTNCTPTDVCTKSVLQGSACTAECVVTSITACVNGDGCCAAGCTPCNDNNCTAAACGDGCVSGTEQCEPPDTTTCDANCKTIVHVPVCGDGTVEGTEQCEPPNTTTCDANCQNIVCADITGTWIWHLNTGGSITQPVGVINGASIDYVMRLYNKKEGDNLVSTVEICSLSATAPDLVTGYSDAVLKTFNVIGSQTDSCATVGKPVTIPTFQILSGTKSATLPTGSSSPCSTTATSTCAAAPDTDGDGKYGITITTTLGSLNVSAYTGLVITINLNDMVLDNATTMSGTTSVANDGFIWGTSLVFGTGPFNVTPASTTIPIEAYLLPGHGDVSCAEVLTHCTTGASGACTP